MVKAISGILSTRIPDGTDTVKVLNNNSFGSQRLNPSYETLRDKDVQSLKKYFFNKGDVAIMCVEPFHVIYILEDDVLATSVLYKVTDNNLSGKEIYKLLNSQRFRSHIKRNVEGTSLKRLSSAHISDFKYCKTDYENAELYFNVVELLENHTIQLNALSKLEKKLCE